MKGVFEKLTTSVKAIGFNLVGIIMRLSGSSDVP
jgi:hypothetical protein